VGLASSVLIKLQMAHKLFFALTKIIRYVNEKQIISMKYNSLFQRITAFFIRKVR